MVIIYNMPVGESAVSTYMFLKTLFSNIWLSTKKLTVVNGKFFNCFTKVVINFIRQTLLSSNHIFQDIFKKYFRILLYINALHARDIRYLYSDTIK